jgi:hypothetical protein
LNLNGERKNILRVRIGQGIMESYTIWRLMIKYGPSA